MSDSALHGAYREGVMLGYLCEGLLALDILFVKTFWRSRTTDGRQYRMATAVSTKISLFTHVVAMSDEGAMPAFWANFLSISNANSTNIRKPIYYNGFMYYF